VAEEEHQPLDRADLQEHEAHTDGEEEQQVPAHTTDLQARALAEEQRADHQQEDEYRGLQEQGQHDPGRRRQVHAQGAGELRVLLLDQLPQLVEVVEERRVVRHRPDLQRVAGEKLVFRVVVDRGGVARERVVLARARQVLDLVGGMVRVVRGGVEFDVLFVQRRQGEHRARAPAVRDYRGVEGRFRDPAPAHLHERGAEDAQSFTRWIVVLAQDRQGACRRQVVEVVDERFTGVEVGLGQDERARRPHRVGIGAGDEDHVELVLARPQDAAPLPGDDGDPRQPVDVAVEVRVVLAGDLHHLGVDLDTDDRLRTDVLRLADVGSPTDADDADLGPLATSRQSPDVRRVDDHVGLERRAQLPVALAVHVGAGGAVLHDLQLGLVAVVLVDVESRQRCPALLDDLTGQKLALVLADPDLDHFGAEPGEDRADDHQHDGDRRGDLVAAPGEEQQCRDGAEGGTEHQHAFAAHRRDRSDEDPGPERAAQQVRRVATIDVLRRAQSQGHGHAAEEVRRQEDAVGQQQDGLRIDVGEEEDPVRDAAEQQVADDHEDAEQHAAPAQVAGHVPRDQGGAERRDRAGERKTEHRHRHHEVGVVVPHLHGEDPHVQDLEGEDGGGDEKQAERRGVLPGTALFARLGHGR